MRRAYGWLLVASFVVGCSDQHPTAPLMAPARPSTSLVPGLDTSEYVMTPNGYYHRSCVYGVPTGGRLQKDGTIRLRDGTVQEMPTCTQPGPVGQSNARTGTLGAATPEGGAARMDVLGAPVPGWHGWAIYGGATTGSGQTIRHVSARWVVPPAPATYSTGKINFLFPGASSSASATIVQPVLQYGVSGAGGGAYWAITGWMCGPTCVHGTIYSVSVGDVIGGWVDATSCSGGQCDWEMTAYDSTSSGGSGLSVSKGTYGSETDDSYTLVNGGALEISQLFSCSDVTSGAHLFSQISFTDNSGSAYTPSYSPGSDPGVTPACGYGETSTSSANVTLLDSLAPRMVASIAGPTGVDSGSVNTWYAIPSGGVSPYSYSWTGLLTGTSSSVTGSPASNGNLTLRIIDAVADTVYAYSDITVCAFNALDCP